MDGPDIFLPPQFAMTLALLIHELATNAAKYGGAIYFSWETFPYLVAVGRTLATRVA
jgi:hypothetical protein